MKLTSQIVLSLMIAAGSCLALPHAYAAEVGGGARKACKPPNCGKRVTKARTNEVAVETLEIQSPRDSASGQAANTSPGAGAVDGKLKPKGPASLSNDEQFPAVRHLSNDEQLPGRGPGH